MRCPYCRENDDKVVDSRTGEDGAAIRRRRECLACGRRFTTYERLDEHGLIVRKRDDTREPFDRDKLRDGLKRAGAGRLTIINAAECASRRWRPMRTRRCARWRARRGSLRVGTKASPTRGSEPKRHRAW